MNTKIPGQLPAFNIHLKISFLESKKAMIFPVDIAGEMAEEKLELDEQS